MDVLIITDATLRGEALRWLLAANADLRVTSCSYEARRTGAARGVDYDVVICDVADATTSARQMIVSLARDWPDRPIVAVAAAGDACSVDCFASGAAGVVQWDSSDDELRASIREVASGHYYAARAVLRGLVGAAHRSSAASADPARHIGVLTAKEQTIVDLLLRGMTNHEIAGAMFLAEPTVKAHLGRIMAKWGVRDRVQVVLKALNAPHSLQSGTNLKGLEK
ncbi:Transcriptional regulatory protein DevR (DosR) [Microbacterium sp. SA39]|nr:Transcriptional regulatory protein DevR (DosR) [Microbacterium sp. SA39]